MPKQGSGGHDPVGTLASSQNRDLPDRRGGRNATRALQPSKEFPMRFVRVLRTVLVGITALACLGSAAAQQIQYHDFSSVANLQMNGSHPAILNTPSGPLNVLRLTDGDPGLGSVHPEATTTWFAVVASGKTGQQPV